MLKNYLQNLYRDAEELNTQNVMAALKITGPHEKLLDVGCWDGVATQNWINAAQATKVYGIEPIKNAAEQAKNKNIEVAQITADKDTWPFESNSIDCIVSNQVIEHLSDVDHFFTEVQRVLRPNGYIITSTNNLSSFHNILSLIFGFAPFDLTNSSKKVSGIGNPLALHKGENDPRGSSWTHKCIYTPKWLGDWQLAYNLKPINYYGAGLYPFPAKLGQTIKLYSAFITIVCQKK